MRKLIKIPVSKEFPTKKIAILPPGQVIKLPVYLAQKCLVTRRTNELQTWLAAHFSYSGKCEISDNPAVVISELVGKKPRTIKRHFKRLLKWNWMGRDSKNGWYFIRGVDRVFNIEGCHYKRAAIMDKSDIPTTKAFLIASVLASIIKTGRATETERKSQRSQPLRGFHPVSLLTLENAFECSKPTAVKYKKMAKKAGYIKTSQNLTQVEGINTSDVARLRKNEQTIMVKKFGSNESITAEPNKIRTYHGRVYIQASTLIRKNLMITKRTSL